MKPSLRRYLAAIILASSLITANLNSAYAATVISSNSDAEGICTQTVDLITGVEVYRYANECVVIFKKVGITS